MLSSALTFLSLSCLLNLSAAQSALTFSTTIDAVTIPITKSPNSTTITTSSSPPPPTPYTSFHAIDEVVYSYDSTAQSLYIEDVERFIDSAGFVTSRTIAGRTEFIASKATRNPSVTPAYDVLYADEPFVCGVTAMSTIAAGQTLGYNCMPVSSAKGEGQRLGNGVGIGAAAAAAAAAAMGVGLL